MPILAILFFVVPILEIYVILKVGSLIGALPTIAIMLASAAGGAYMAQSQGRQAWARFTTAMASGKMPGREISDGAMIIFGGALLVSPGFLTDLAGLSLLFPPTRMIYRKAMVGAAKRTPAGAPVFVWQHRPDRFRQSPGADGGEPSEGFRGPTPDPFGQARPSQPQQAYDVEGTAREIPSEPGELESDNV